MKYVVDCSFSSAIFLPDEKSSVVRNFFTTLQKDDQISVPILWWYETLNVLNVAIKRKRITYSDFITVINSFNQLKFSTDYEYGIDISREIFDITEVCNITAYDAVYIELAKRKRAKLMTHDRALLSAAKQMGLDT